MNKSLLAEADQHDREKNRDEDEFYSNAQERYLKMEAGTKSQRKKINIPRDQNDISTMIFHDVMNGRCKVFGLTPSQILVLKHWYEGFTGKRPEDIDVG